MQRVHFHRTRNDAVELSQEHDETSRRDHVNSLAVEKFLELFQPFRRQLDEVPVSQDQAAATETTDQVSGAIAKYGADEYGNQYGFDIERSMQGKQRACYKGAFTGQGCAERFKIYDYEKRERAIGCNIWFQKAHGLAGLSADRTKKAPDEPEPEICNYHISRWNACR